jgi:hypothetical protein
MAEQNESEEIVGFNRPDAMNLLGSLPNAGSELVTPQHRPPMENVLGRTGAGGIAANSAGQVTLYYTTSTNWTLGTEVWDVFTRGAAIPANTDCLVVPVNGRWLALGIC